MDVLEPPQAAIVQIATMAMTIATRPNQKRCDARFAFRFVGVANYARNAKPKNASSHAVRDARGKVTGRFEKFMKSCGCQNLVVVAGVATTLTGVVAGLFVTCTIADIAAPSNVARKLRLGEFSLQTRRLCGECNPLQARMVSYPCRGSISRWDRISETER